MIHGAGMRCVGVSRLIGLQYDPLESSIPEISEVDVSLPLYYSVVLLYLNYLGTLWRHLSSFCLELSRPLIHEKSFIRWCFVSTSQALLYSSYMHPNAKTIHKAL